MSAGSSMRHICEIGDVSSIELRVYTTYACIKFPQAVLGGLGDMPATDLVKLNLDWDADPDASRVVIEARGVDVVLRFRLEHRTQRRFAPGDCGYLRFRNVTHYRLGAPDQKAWLAKDCRYRSKLERWGDLHEVIGPDERRLWPKDWRRTKAVPRCPRHFLFQLGEGTFECIADSWILEPRPDNALITRRIGPGPVSEMEAGRPGREQDGLIARAGSVIARAQRFLAMVSRPTEPRR
jgi:hypothetical protein